MSLHHAQKLLNLYQQVEHATTRKEVKAILAEAERLRLAASPGCGLAPADAQNSTPPAER